MALYRPKYLVEYDPSHSPLEVTVSSGDMMRAELEVAKLRLPERAPFHLTALWLWSALVRMEVEERKAQDFIKDPPEFEPIKVDGKATGEGVDPTAGTGVSDSASPVSTVTPPTG